MADLAATDVTLTIHRGTNIFYQDNGMKFVVANATFGNGVKTYNPTSGLPLPAAGRFGLKTIVFGGVINDPSDDAHMHKYDSTNHAIIIYDPAIGAEESGAYAPSARTLTLFLVGK